MTEFTVNAAPGDFERLDIIGEITGRQRRRAFSYPAFIDLLGEGTALSVSDKDARRKAVLLRRERFT